MYIIGIFYRFHYPQIKIKLRYFLSVKFYRSFRNYFIFIIILKRKEQYLATKSRRVHIVEITNTFRLLEKKLVSYNHLDSRVVQARVILKGISDMAW
jgi:hypothetical protein